MRDLARYLRRIGIASAPKADFATLALVMAAQSRAIAFENIDVVLRRAVSMDRVDVEEKLVAKGRGGYCWEQNTLLAAALEEIGFEVTPLLCRVRWNKPDDAEEPNTTYTHLALKVETEAGAHLADVGFAGTNSMAPVRLGTPEVQALPEGAFRVAASVHPECSVLQLLVKGEWKALYEWRDERAPLVDQICGNWYSCTFPSARFTTSFFCCRIIGEERHHILNGEYVVRKGHGVDSVTTTTRITDKAHLLRLTREVFGIDHEDEEGIDRYL